jgi:hypothetical protein
MQQQTNTTATMPATTVTDSSSSEYQSTDSSSPSELMTQSLIVEAILINFSYTLLCYIEKSASLLSRIFRRSCRNPSKKLESYSAQFPPREWFNSKAVHLVNVGTQTLDHHVSYFFFIH